MEQISALDPIIELATLDADGPTGTFIDRLGPVAW